MGKQGFLDDIDLQIIRGDEGKSKSKKQKQKVFTCADCGLNMQCQTPKFPVWGNGKKKILIVLDTLSSKEDEMSEPFSGVRGALLKELLEDRLNIKVKRDCWVTYAVSCCCKKQIKSYNVDACRKYLHENINELNPSVIIPFGYWAMIGISGDILTGKSRGKYTEEWTDYIIPDQRFLKWIIPTWDTFQLKLETDKQDTVKIKQFISHWQNAIDLINVSVKKIDYEKRIKILKSDVEIISVLKELNDRAKLEDLILALDYETTGRKPHRKGHEIISISISDGIKSWVFYYNKNNNDVTILFRQLLIQKKVYWRVHNIQLEWAWSFFVFGVYPANLDQDTILGVHVLNSNKRKGLKPNVYCFFGIAGYDNNVEEFISAPPAEEKMYGANAFNLMKQKKDEKDENALLYNGLDTLFEYLLAEYIKKNLRKANWIGYRFLMESAINLCKAQENGMRVDTNGVSKAKDKLTTEMSVLEKTIQRMVIKAGWNRDDKFNPNASADISRLLFDIMGYKSVKETKTGGASTDKEVLEKINDPIVAPILEWKKLQKLKNTYINGLVVEVVDGLMRPFFNMYSTVTYRGSSSNFNFQNVPKRDEFSNKIIRELLYPHIGHKINEHDLKGAEVVTAACYCLDRNLIKYITTPSTDMHRDTGIELFMYDDNPQDFLKFDRQVTKGEFVFAEFYGDYYKNCAGNLWNGCSKEAKENLRKHGIKKLGSVDPITNKPEKGTFVEHVREIEKKFWTERFSEYAQWKKDTYNFYLKHGYIDSLTGFRYYGPMSKNEALNRCIQGSAHHILLFIFNRISDVIAKKKMQTKLMGQIHDSIVSSVYPDEENYFNKMIWYYGTQEIRNVFDWIIVPVEIEKSSGHIDEPWSEIKEDGLLGVNGRIIKK